MVISKHPEFAGVPGPVVTIVMDGVGIGRHDASDAVFLAETPTLDALLAGSHVTSLCAHGKAVGLPSNDDMGNSEVGHNALGSGQIFDQGAKLVSAAIANGSLFLGATWTEAIGRVLKGKTTLHLMGLLSDGNVHSHIDHLLALIDRANLEGVTRLRVHALLDGRDVPETSALTYVDRLEDKLQAIRESRGDRDYRIGSGGGRMKITMDRYGADWPMVARGYDAHVHGKGRRFSSLADGIRTLRAETEGIGDQNLSEMVIVDSEGEPIGRIEDGSSVLFFNFRGDRAIEITRAFEEDAFTAFDRGRRPDVFFAGMMQYDGDLSLPARYLVSPPTIKGTLSDVLTDLSIAQFAISETQKFGHVTYFWNGNRSGKVSEKLETFVEIPSSHRPFEEEPEMQAAAITARLLEALRSGNHRFFRVNYANGDMVGHTGVLPATIAAVEAVDRALAQVLPVVRALGGATIVTADHGNADEMLEWDKKRLDFARSEAGALKPKTSHTLNPVPCIIDTAASLPPLKVDRSGKFDGGDRAGIANVTATALALLGYAAPSDYERSLF